eukprot:COSAG01_NODE_5437_length_4260_cov_27.965898_7_plen_197_part_00
MAQGHTRCPHPLTPPPPLAARMNEAAAAEEEEEATPAHSRQLAHSSLANPRGCGGVSSLARRAPPPPPPPPAYLSSPAPPPAAGSCVCAQFVAEGHLRWDSLGEYLAIAVSLEDLGEKTNNARAKLLGETLTAATASVLDNRLSPSRKVLLPLLVWTACAHLMACLLAWAPPAVGQRTRQSVDELSHRQVLGCLHG